MECRFNIRAWQAASDRLADGAQWQAWAAGALDAGGLPEQRVELPFLPPMQRRRLGLSARLLFRAAHGLVDAACPLVLVSHDGEINRSFDLWRDLLSEQGAVSPTSFGLSVHNALAGQWSMLRGDMSENTALAAAEGAWETAVSEAAAILADGAERVLVAAVDEPLREAAQPAVRAPFAYAVAALLEAGGDWSLRHEAAADVPAAGYWGALDWVRQTLSGSCDWSVAYRGGGWRWTRRV